MSGRWNSRLKRYGWSSELITWIHSCIMKLFLHVFNIDSGQKRRLQITAKISKEWRTLKPSEVFRRSPTIELKDFQKFPNKIFGISLRNLEPKRKFFKDNQRHSNHVITEISIFRYKLKLFLHIAVPRVH